MLHRGSVRRCWFPPPSPCPCHKRGAAGARFVCAAQETHENFELLKADNERLRRELSIFKKVVSQCGLGSVLRCLLSAFVFDELYVCYMFAASCKAVGISSREHADLQMENAAMRALLLESHSAEDIQARIPTFEGSHGLANPCSCKHLQMSASKGFVIAPMCAQIILRSLLKMSHTCTACCPCLRRLRLLVCICA